MPKFSRLSIKYFHGVKLLGNDLFGVGTKIILSKQK